MVNNHISLKTGFGSFAIRRTSFLSWFQAWSSSSSGSSSAFRTPVKQESHSSSSSSSSPSSPTVGEISVREREDAPDSDISPVPMSELVDDRSGKPEEIQANEIPKTNKKETPMERRNPCDSEIPEWLQEFRENLVDDEIPVQGGSHASSSHEVSLEPTPKKRDVRIWVNTMFILISLKTEIARSVNGPKLQGPHAEDAMAKPYLEPQILVT